MEERQGLKDLEDQLIDVLQALDTTSDTIRSLLEQCEQFHSDTKDMSQGVGSESYNHIEYALREKQRDVQSSRRKVESLHDKVQGTTNLVSSSSMLDL